MRLLQPYAICVVVVQDKGPLFLVRMVVEWRHGCHQLAWLGLFGDGCRCHPLSYLLTLSAKNEALECLKFRGRSESKWFRSIALQVEGALPPMRHKTHVDKNFGKIGST